MTDTDDDRLDRKLKKHPEITLRTGTQGRKRWVIPVIPVMRIGFGAKLGKARRMIQDGATICHIWSSTPAPAVLARLFTRVYAIEFQPTLLRTPGCLAACDFVPHEPTHPTIFLVSFPDDDLRSMAGFTNVAVGVIVPEARCFCLSGYPYFIRVSILELTINLQFSTDFHATVHNLRDSTLYRFRVTLRGAACTAASMVIPLQHSLHVFVARNMPLGATSAIDNTSRRKSAAVRQIAVPGT
ncbi:hypothetical protein P175DRAFT_0534658 [Aspergillus ochraceoroseus IBT 24754]|uniref:Uncharacterized protein n=1 Tax=Aspergillus ochraceoroseus IBT 24754 TaxID=1392256 RepID=A0A2T5LRH4_9EURO|nr:uncharacterized protein P175DRAFT_0534658 [Aspergillus ochraceoroseus IBT 24754]PTU18880.1 hypothetical protein P175DRAFT_0534658 [Aspergillus ochraceoroseus IBT 24754]